MSFTGLRQEQLTLTTMRGSGTRTVFEALVIFLFQMRTGTSNETISSLSGP